MPVTCLYCSSVMCGSSENNNFAAFKDFTAAMKLTQNILYQARTFSCAYCIHTHATNTHIQ